MEQKDFSIVVLSDTTCAIKRYSGSDETVEVPSVIEKDGKAYQVVEIGPSSFKQNKKMKHLSLPEGVTIIGEGAFNGCDYMEDVKLPSSLVEMKDNVFKGCFKLDGVQLPSSLTAMGEHCFEYCKSLSAIALPSGLKVIASKAFTNCGNLERLTIAEGVESIKDNAFCSCKIAELEIPSSVKEIDKRAFYDCSKLTLVVISEALKDRLDSSVFAGCSSLKFSYGASSASSGDASSATQESAPNTSSEESVKVSDASLYHIEVLSDNTCAIVKYTGSEEIVRIPSELQKGGKSYKVVEIGQLAFAKKKTPGQIAWEEELVENTNLISVVIIPESVDPNYNGYQTIREVIIPEGVKTISKAAFYSCVALEKVSFPKTLEKLDVGAFAFCTHLKSVSLPDGVLTIPEYAFEYCENLESFSSKGVKEIKKSAFTKCKNLKNLSLSENVNIEAFAFLSCDYMRDNKVSSDAGASMAMFQMKPVTDKTCNISGFEGEGDVIVVPSEMHKNGKTYKVIGIAGYAFSKKKKIGKVVLPDTVEMIADNAFASSSLTEIEIPSSVKEIKDYAFDDCAQLKKVVLPDGLSLLGKNAFSSCVSLESISIPNSIRSISSSLFLNCTALEHVDLPADLESIEGSAFGNCISLEKIDLPKHLRKIATNSFYDARCKVDAFEYTELSGDTCILNSYLPAGPDVILNDSVYIKGSLRKVVKIADSVFMEKKIETVTLPAFVETIGRSAFSNCKKLVSVVIPSSLKSLGELAFVSCESLREITLPESVSVISDKAFSSCSSLEKITVPGVREFKKRAFANCSQLKVLEGLQSIVLMGEETFLNCKSLDLSASGKNGSSVILAVKPIEGNYYTISGFMGDGDVTIPSEFQIDDMTYKVVDIYKYAFAKCKSVKKVVLPESLVCIGEYAFSESSLTEIELPNGLKEIGRRAFGDCNNLKRVDIPDSVEKLGDSAFAYCQNLVEVNVPSHTALGKDVFLDCPKLKR